MFSKIGTMELLLILIVALFVIGPEKLPGVAKKAGKVYSSARKYLTGLTDEVQEELKSVTDDLKEVDNDLKAVGKDIRESTRLVKDPPKITEAAESSKKDAESEAADVKETPETAETAQAEETDGALKPEHPAEEEAGVPNAADVQTTTA